MAIREKCYKYNTPIGVERYKNAEGPHSGDMFIEYYKPKNIKPRSGEMNFAILLQIAQWNSKVSGRELDFRIYLNFDAWILWFFRLEGYFKNNVY